MSVYRDCTYYHSDWVAPVHHWVDTGKCIVHRQFIIIGYYAESYRLTMPKDTPIGIPNRLVNGVVFA